MAWKIDSMYLTMPMSSKPLTILCFLTSCVLSACSGNADAQLLRDDFDGTGIIDPAVWRIPFDSEGTFNGRTQYRLDFDTDFPLQGVAEAAALDGKVVELDLDTFSPLDPGNQFLGTDILTKRNFARGGGLTLEARLRLKPPTTGGVVGGFFLFDVTRDVPAGSGTLVRDEIDWELLGNQVSSGTQQPATNYWNDGTFDDGGPLELHELAGVDLTQFQDYRIEWTPDHVKWYVNDNLVRTETTNVPGDPQTLHFNVWAPDNGFTEAFDGNLQPTSNAGANQKFQVQVDYVEVNRINTTTSEKLVDGSFEETPFFSLSSSFPNPPLPIGINANTATAEWFSFNNAFLAFGDEVTPSDGFTTIKAFGPNSGESNASGAYQNVAAQPGQEFAASVKAQIPSFDTIRPQAGGDFNEDNVVNAADYVVWRDNLGATIGLPNDTTGETVVGQAQYDLWKDNFGATTGTDNFSVLRLTFHDQFGNVLKEAFGSPQNMVDIAEQVPLFDGRQPSVTSLEDQWIEYAVDAVAPDGTSFVRYNLFFIQSISGEAGAIHFDEASLLLLEPVALGAVEVSANVPEPTACLLLVPALLAAVGWRCSRQPGPTP